ncbi:MAG TPA: PAS domain S-box protein [Chloroflexia bacterium]
MSRPVTTHGVTATHPQRASGTLSGKPLYRLFAQARHLLPEGGTLAEHSWQRRHRAIMVLLWLHLAFVFAFGLAMGTDIKQVLFGTFLIGFLGLIAREPMWKRGLRSGAASLAMLTASSLLVNFSNGLTEMHFHFFVMVSLIALYQDWLPFLLAIAFVFFEHALVGVINPHMVYSHSAAWAEPWMWAGIHAIFITGLSIVSIVNWHINETERQSTQSILDAAGEGIYGLDTSNRITFANPSALRMLGYLEKDVVGMPYSALLAAGHDFDLDTEVSDASDADGEMAPGKHKGGTPSTYFRRKDGTTFPVEYLSAPTRKRNLPVGSVVTFRDITERLLTEQALKNSERYYRSLFENAHDAILIFDPDGEIVLDANVQACEMYGFAREELVGQSLEQIAEDVEAGKQRVRQVLEQGFDYRFVTRQRRKDGSTMHVDISASVVDYMGRRAILSINRDFTERVENEASIKREAERVIALSRVASRLNAQLDLDALLQALCEELASALGMEGASVALLDEKRQALVVQCEIGLPEERNGKNMEIPMSVYDHFASRSGPSMLVEDVRSFAGVPEFEPSISLGIRTCASASMLRDGQLVGILSAFSVGEPRKLTQDALFLMQGIADQATQAIVNARLFTEGQRRLDFVQALHSIDVAISSSHDSRVTFQIILDKVLGQLKVDAADLLLLNPSTLMLEYAAGCGYRTDTVKQTRVRVGDPVAGQAALTRRNMYVPDLREAADSACAPLVKTEGFVSLMCVPLIAKGHVLGVLRVFQRSMLEPDKEWVNYLEGLAGQAAIAIDNATLFDDLQRSNIELGLAYDRTLEGWSGALDLRDKETEGHTQRVTEMAVRLARSLNVREGALVHLRRGALLHDIGKMGIPDSILLKPGPLSDEEWAVMKCHPVYAHELLAPIDFLRPALDIPYCHHEKWDGTGYPRGLRGEQIPFAARIFAVVDVWDALSSDRPYRPAWPQEKVREHIASLSGTHFDPVVVEAFLEMVEQDDRRLATSA